MKISARNQLPGTVKTIRLGDVEAEVTLGLGTTAQAVPGASDVMVAVEAG